MGEHTAISWCHHTKNLWWGCWKIDPECENCYADELANRYAAGHWGRKNPRKFFDDKNLNELLKWNRAAQKAGERRRVFVGSMMDWAEIHPIAEINARMDERRAAFWRLVTQCDWLDFLMLTKRPENVPALLPPGPVLPNVWHGVSAGSVHSLRTKGPLLRQINAAVRFISCEPMLEGIPREEWDEALRSAFDCTDACGRNIKADEDGTCAYCGADIDCMALRGPDWLIVGDESGHDRRPARADWVRIARDAAARNRVAFHFKQWNSGDGDGIAGQVDRKRKIHLPILDGAQHAAFPEVSR